MQWILRGRQLGQAVKNVQRLRQILAVFAKHGFADVIVRMNLGRYLGSRLRDLSEREADKSPHQRLRECFEELGPAFVKFGQLLSTRPDLIPEPFVEEFTVLQDHVLPISFEQIQKVIEEELKSPIAQHFTSIDSSPLASASIAQVHAATLLTGESVALKVQRPGIEKKIKTDVSLLAFIARLLEKYVPETQVASPIMIVEEFSKSLTLELDFVIEANNMAKISSNLSGFEDIVIPEVYRPLSTSRLITMQRLEGTPLNNPAVITSQHLDKKHLVELGARAFFKTVMIDGLFHGDLHGGNLFALPDGRLGILDFGIVGRLSQKSRDRLANMFMSLITEDYENLCYQYAELGAVDPTIDFQNFEREVRNAVAPYIGLSISEVNSGRVLIETTKIATKYHIRVPGDWMIVFKALLTMEGMGRALDPEFDLLEIGQDLLRDLVKSQYSFKRIQRDLVWIAKDLGSLLQMLPRQIRWMFRKFNRNDFALDIRLPQLQELREDLKSHNHRLSVSILAGALILASSLSLQYTDSGSFAGIPLMSALYLVVGILFAIRALFF